MQLQDIDNPTPQRSKDQYTTKYKELQKSFDTVSL